MTKCNMCHGKGFVSLGKGIRGVKKCETCRGSGNIEELAPSEVARNMGRATSKSLVSIKESLEYLRTASNAIESE